MRENGVARNAIVRFKDEKVNPKIRHTIGRQFPYDPHLHGNFTVKTVEGRYAVVTSELSPGHARVETKLLVPVH